MHRLLPRGGCHVKLENGHVIRALPPLNGPSPIANPGEQVIAEIALNQLKGWRLRRPDSPDGAPHVVSG
ncbi:hypothetical protein [Brevundimonas sp. FT23042]|uniref:hypothetical protein n=1 Tax=Brevundimonas sp. FT23042 TaxID=3393749 RepID=UPI003B58A020